MGGGPGGMFKRCTVVGVFDVAPSPSDTLKINVDTTFFYQYFETSIGIVLHNENDMFICGRTLTIHGR